MSAETAAVLDVHATHVARNSAQVGQLPANTDEPVGNHAAIRITTGEPSDEHIAVLTAVLAAASASPIAPISPMNSLGAWGSPAEQLRYGLSTAPVHFVNAHYSR